MLTEKIARKSLNIGAYHLNPGDVLDNEVEQLLPPGRVKVLMDQGWLSERPVVEVGFAVDTAILDRLAELEARVAALEARRGPGRPRKDENSGI